VHSASAALARGTRVNSLHGPALASPLAPAGIPGRPLVAVLPFTPCGNDPQLALLGTEIADRVRERLAADPATQAILISSDFLAKAPPHALELICRELRVGYLVSGKCHATGAEPSLYVELTTTRNWHIRWAEFHRFGARRLLADEGEAMGRLVANLRTSLAEHRMR
jgi:TolB-like protein